MSPLTMDELRAAYNAQHGAPQYNPWDRLWIGEIVEFAQRQMALRYEEEITRLNEALLELCSRATYQPSCRACPLSCSARP